MNPFRIVRALARVLWFLCVVACWRAFELGILGWSAGFFVLGVAMSFVGDRGGRNA